MSVVNINLGRVAGSRWYNGTALVHTTGSATTATGIEYALEGDLYINTDTYSIYECTTAGASGVAVWTWRSNILTSGPLAPVVTNLGSSSYSNNLRSEKLDGDDSTYDTRGFMFYMVDPQPDGWSGYFRAARSGRTVTFYCHRPKANGVVVTAPEYYYHFKNDGTHDHHNFGVVLPSGMRPYGDVFFRVEAIDKDDVRYWGAWRVMPDGSFGGSTLYKVSDNTSASELWLDGLFFSVTFVAEA